MDFTWIPHGMSHVFSMVFPFDFPWISHGSIFNELQNVSVVVAGTPLGVRKQSRHRHILEMS